MTEYAHNLLNKHFVYDELALLLFAQMYHIHIRVITKNGKWTTVRGNHKIEPQITLAFFGNNTFYDTCEIKYEIGTLLIESDRSQPFNVVPKLDVDMDVINSAHENRDTGASSTLCDDEDEVAAKVPHLSDGDLLDNDLLLQPVFVEDPVSPSASLSVEPVLPASASEQVEEPVLPASASEQVEEPVVPALKHCSIIVKPLSLSDIKLHSAVK